jgi:hypothetical protein
MLEFGHRGSSGFCLLRRNMVALTECGKASLFGVTLLSLMESLTM